MEAKDTVMNDDLIKVWCLEFVQPGELDLNAKLKEFAQAQAKISFKAGKKEERKRIINKAEKELYLISPVPASNRIGIFIQALKGEK